MSDEEMKTYKVEVVFDGGEDALHDAGRALVEREGRGADDEVDAVVRVTDVESGAVTLWSALVEPDVRTRCINAGDGTFVASEADVLEALAASTPEGDPGDERNPRVELRHVREELRKEREKVQLLGAQLQGSAYADKDLLDEVVRLREALARARRRVAYFLEAHGAGLPAETVERLQAEVGVDETYRDAHQVRYAGKPVEPPRGEVLPSVRSAREALRRFVVHGPALGPGWRASLMASVGLTEDDLRGGL